MSHFLTNNILGGLRSAALLEEVYRLGDGLWELEVLHYSPFYAFYFVHIVQDMSSRVPALATRLAVCCYALIVK